ncbi:hypothetical protein Bbelb_188780 [Branchiostoma belcheri]|nr:hypothetical protein Bbelb_188780 [Branchiostoma belcheri]
MLQSRAVAFVLFLFLSSQLLFVLAVTPRCPEDCRTEVFGVPLWPGIHCFCPDENAKGSPCSWVGYEGRYSFPVCLDAIPANFDKRTQSVTIRHLRSSVLLERSFKNASRISLLTIERSNISKIQPGAFKGLPFVRRLTVADNLISSLVDDQILRLTQNQPFKALLLADNKLNCDRNLTWFICNLEKLDLIVNRWSLRCASPDNRKGTPLTMLKTCTDDTQTEPNWPKWDKVVIGGNVPRTSSQSPESISTLNPYNQTASNHTDAMLHASNKPHNKTMPTENYTHTSSMPTPNHTTELYYVNLAGGDAIINLDDTGSNLIALILAILLPIILVILAVIILASYHNCLCLALAIFNIPTDGENEDETDDETVQPYAVVYADSADLQATDRDSVANSNQATTGSDQSEGNTNIQTENDKFEVLAVIHHEDSHKEDQRQEHNPEETTHEDPQPELHPREITHDGDPGKQLQPYAVTYTEQDDNASIQPYAITYDTEQDDNSTIQPYAVAYLYPLKTAKRNTAALEATPNQQETTDTQSAMANTEPHYCNKEVEDNNQQEQDENSTCENATDQDETIAKKPLAESCPTRANTEPIHKNVINEVNKENAKERDENATEQDETIVKQPLPQSEGQLLPTDAEFDPKHKDGDIKALVKDDKHLYGMGKGEDTTSVISGTLYGGDSQNAGAEKCSISQVLYNSADGQPSGHLGL